MLRKTLPVALGVLLGLFLAAAAARLAPAWTLFPGRDLGRSTDYMREVLKLVHENYVDADKAAYTKLTREALHGMVETLDPHSEFLEEREFSALDEEMRGDFGGIGIQVEAREGRFVVIAPIAGTPAEKAGILRGDQILAIDGKLVSLGMSMDQVVDQLRGEPGSKVSVKLLRPGSGRQYEVVIKRERIKVESVRVARVLPDGTGYLQLSEFTEHTGEEFDKALEELLNQGIHSLVLDLRNNPGGLLDVAVYVAEPFFPKGELIVYTEGRKPDQREELRSETDGEPLSMPVAVLINAGSASAAEIVAGAFKDSGRGLIVGERSFGKGSVQTVFTLRDGEGMRLTTARYFTPSGISIHGRGIEPQIEVVVSPEEDERILEWRSRGDLQDPAAYEARFGVPPPADRQLDAALDALRGLRLLKGRGYIKKPDTKAPVPPTTLAP